MTISIQRMASILKRDARKWHPELVHALERYASAKPVLSASRRAATVTQDPYWLLIPQWLGRQDARSRRLSGRFVRDILRGQFCAFLAVKMQDDVFDGHVRDGSLIFAADHLLLSAREAFGPHFAPDSRFWPFFDRSLRRTFNAIVECDHSQVHGFGPPPSVVALASHGYAVCDLATYAMCCRKNNPGLFRSLKQCTDELAFVGQLLDDLEDMMVDARRGRLNYAARFLSDRRTRTGKDVMRSVVRGLVIGRRVGRFFRMLYRHLDRAREVAARIEIPELYDFVARYRESIEASHANLDRATVDMVFGTALRRGTKDPPDRRRRSPKQKRRRTV